MKTIRQTLILSFCLVLLAACQKANKKLVVEPDNLNSLYTKTAQTLFTARPTSATMFGVDKDLAGGNYNNRLEDYSPKSENQLRQSLLNLNITYKKNKNNDVNKDVMQVLSRYFAGNEEFPIGYIDTWMGLSPFIVNQINGPLIDVPNIMITNQQIYDIKDAKDYIARLDHYDIFVEHVLEKMEKDAEQGWIPPLVIVNKSIATMQDFIKVPPESHALVTSFMNKIVNIQSIDKKTQSNLKQRVVNLVSQKVYPAYHNVITHLQDLGMSAPSESGIWVQPNGAEYYKDAVKMLGDTTLTPAQIHQLGLNEVKRILHEMDNILRQAGFKQGTVGQRMLALNNDERFLYEDSDVGRQQLLNDLNGYITAIDARMDEQFATRPIYKVEVRKFPKSREASAPGGMYTNPPIDGSKPGIYWINLRDIKANAKFDLKTLTYHEAIPGHHWQVALNLQQKQMPMLRRIAPFNAYIEGWALYAEQVAAEMGMYKNDAFGDLGRLKAELFRAVRLVVDTGLHYKKWSREKAIKYMAETTGTVDSDVIAEIERYMIWPGQALGYKLGMINILKLRTMAQTELGKKFDIKAFHDLILLGGAVPMSILNKKVEAWIESQR